MGFSLRVQQGMPCHFALKGEQGERPTNACLCDNFPQKLPFLQWILSLTFSSINMSAVLVLYRTISRCNVPPAPVGNNRVLPRKEQLHLPFRPIRYCFDASWVRKLSLQHDLPHTLNQQAVKFWVLSLVFKRLSCAGPGSY